MAAEFTVYAFGVKLHDGSQSLEDVLKLIQSETLLKRNRVIKSATIRIEDIKFSNGAWYMDFIKIRKTHGPGKGSETKPVQGFTFTGDETFCEETALMFIPATNHLLVQYNHYGVRFAAIEEYFSQYNKAVNNVYELTAKYDDDTERQFEARKSIRKLELAIDPRQLTASDKKAGTALTDAIGIGDKSDAASVALTISAGTSKKSKLTKFIDKTVTHLKKLATTKPDAVSKINASVVTLDDKVLVLDLIAHRLKTTVGGVPLGLDRRWSVADRYHALDKVKLQWKNKLK